MKIIPFKLFCESSERDAKTALLIKFKQLAEEVASMRSYGVRSIFINRTSWIAYWSNAQTRWDVSYQKALKGTTIRLDANGLLIDTKTKKVAQMMADCLPALPLYAASYEKRNDEAQLKWLAANVSPNSEQYKLLVSMFGEDVLKIPPTNIVAAVERFMDKIGFSAQGPTPEGPSQDSNTN